MPHSISGIYIITCNTNGKVYVGQSQRIHNRWKGHIGLLVKGTHGNEHLQRAWNKYGEENFVFEILLSLDPADSPELSDYWEDYFIRIFKSIDREYGFNRSEVGHGCSDAARIETAKANKARVWTEEMREKIRIANSKRIWSRESREKDAESQRALPPQSAKTREKKRIAATGRTHSDEVKKKIGLKHKGKIVSEETRRKLSEFNKGKPSPTKGKKMSEESRKKMSESAIKARTGKKHSEATKKKISEALKGKKRESRSLYKKEIKPEVCSPLDPLLPSE
jgi:group I intron endonuclease